MEVVHQAVVMGRMEVYILGEDGSPWNEGWGWRRAFVEMHLYFIDRQACLPKAEVY